MISDGSVSMLVSLPLPSSTRLVSCCNARISTDVEPDQPISSRPGRGFYCRRVRFGCPDLRHERRVRLVDPRSCRNCAAAVERRARGSDDDPLTGGDLTIAQDETALGRGRHIGDVRGEQNRIAGSCRVERLLQLDSSRDGHTPADANRKCGAHRTDLIRIGRIDTAGRQRPHCRAGEKQRKQNAGHVDVGAIDMPSWPAELWTISSAARSGPRPARWALAAPAAALPARSHRFRC